MPAKVRADQCRKESQTGGRGAARAGAGLPRAAGGYEPADLERDLNFVGLVGMIDALREEVRAASAPIKA